MNIRPTMNNDEQIKFIDELRELKEMKKLTLEQIVERTEQNGERVCLSTVKSVFSENTKHKHDYNNTLIPIFNALSDEKDDDNPVNHILRTRLATKMETIRKLEEQIQIMRDEYDKRLTSKDEKSNNRIQFLIKQLNKKDDEIAFKNEQIRHHYEAMDDKDRLISELYTKIFDLQNIIIEMQKNK